jgi:hypothetical protein
MFRNVLISVLYQTFAAVPTKLLQVIAERQMDEFLMNSVTKKKCSLSSENSDYLILNAVTI